MDSGQHDRAALALLAEVCVNPDGEPGWDGPLDVQIPDDARELERDVLAYRRELRALRRRRRLRRLLPSHAGIMPLMASVLAVCLVAGMMLSVFTITPGDDSTKPHVQSTQATATRAPSTQPSHSAGARTPSGTPAPAVTASR
jgi:hypothetical protein